MEGEERERVGVGNSSYKGGRVEEGKSGLETPPTREVASTGRGCPLNPPYQGDFNANRGEGWVTTLYETRNNHAREVLNRFRML